MRYLSCSVVVIGDCGACDPGLESHHLTMNTRVFVLNAIYSLGESLESAVHTLQ